MEGDGIIATSGTDQARTTTMDHHHQQHLAPTSASRGRRRTTSGSCLGVVGQSLARAGWAALGGRGGRGRKDERYLIDRDEQQQQQQQQTTGTGCT